MYVILVYDVKQVRGARMLKLCRRYLNWIQNSVLEGEITEVKLRELLGKARSFLNEDEDSVIIFKNRNQQWLDKEIIGQERNLLGNFL